MKIVFDNLTETVTADANESGFPAGFMLNEHSLKKWKAGATTATITASLSTGSNALAMHNVVADLVIVTVGSDDPVTYTMLSDDGWGEYRETSLYHAYTAKTGTHTAIIELTSATLEVDAGILFSGIETEWTMPKWGVDISGKSHSIVYDLDNGFEYTFRRNKSNTPKFTIASNDQLEVFNFKRLAEAHYPSPLILYIDTLVKPVTYYGRMDSFPKIQLTTYNNYVISFGLKEFL